MAADTGTATETAQPPQTGLRPVRVLGALLVNLIPVVGVLFWGWSAAALMLLYWLENVVIGAFNVLRMVASGLASGPAGIAAILFIVPFFTFHYGMFCLVHGMFVWTLFGQGLPQLEGVGGPFDISALVSQVLAATPGLRAGFISIVIWQALMFLVFFIGRGEYKRTDPMSQMAAPYGRIVVLHITIIAGAFIVLALGQPLFALLILTLLKTAFDVFGAQWEKQNNSKAAEAWAKGRAQLAEALRKKSAPRPPE